MLRRRRRSHKLRANSRRRRSRRMSRNVNYALVSNRRRSRKLRSNRRRSRRMSSNRRTSRRMRSNRRHSRRMRSNRRRSRRMRSNRRTSRRMRSNRRTSRRMRRNVNYAIVSNRRSRRRASRRVRSNRRRSRGAAGRGHRIRRNSAAMRRAIAKEFASAHKPPMVGRIKRLFDKPSRLTYFGPATYSKKFGKLKAAEAQKYARRLGLVANTLVGAVRSGVGQRVGSPYQIVETSEGSRMWDASYPITVAAYQTQGYVRDFKLGGIAKRKALAPRGTRFSGGRKRKQARNI